MSKQSFTNKTFDAAIIGGGIIGLALARELKKRGVEYVALIESNSQVGLESSWAAGGMLAPQSEANEADSFFKLCSASRDLYEKFSSELFEETNIDVELERTGTLYPAFNENDLAEIEKRYEWQSKAGLQIEKLNTNEAHEIEPFVSEKILGALRFQLDVQVENRLVVKALNVACEKFGVEIFTETKAETLLIEDGKIIGVETSKGIIRAETIIIACGAWASFLKFTDNNIKAINVEPVRGQMLCFASSERKIRHVIYSPRGYVVPRLDGRIIAGSTSERIGFEKQVTCEGVNAITQIALEIAPPIAQLPLVDYWSGLRPCSQNEKPIIGESEKIKGLYYATGHYRNGILLAPITAELLAEEIVNGNKSMLLNDFAPNGF
jgi:glycine oxidase